MAGAERTRVEGFGRLEDGLRDASDWYLWGPYLSERQWGTVREDYSADGEAWDYLPHDHARSRAYRWGEDGMAGFCDIEQRLCLGLALWNGRDPILKERMFGLTGAQGNHGEDVKEYWWYLDAVPSHAWNRWRYHYPQRAFPYDDLDRRERAAQPARARVRAARHRRLRRRPLLDRRGRLREGRPDRPADDGARHQRRSRRRHAPRAADRLVPQHVVVGARRAEAGAVGRADDGSVAVDHPFLGELRAAARPPARTATRPRLLFCENETNVARLYGAPATPFPKDAINDHVVDGRRRGQPRAARHQGGLLVPSSRSPPARPSSCACACAPCRRPRHRRPRGAARHRLRRRGAAAPPGGRRVLRRAAAPPTAPTDAAMVMRQAFAGMLWSKQLYAYDVARWLAGDPTQPPPPASRRNGRNSRWSHFEAFDIMSMPDKWEYPWFAAWDLAFHCVALAHVDPAFAKYQLILVCREWFQHPERRAARLRVGLRRREPAGAGVGRARGLRHRRRHATSTSSAVSSTSCSSTSRGG